MKENKTILTEAVVEELVYDRFVATTAEESITFLELGAGHGVLDDQAVSLPGALEGPYGRKTSLMRAGGTLSTSLSLPGE